MTAQRDAALAYAAYGWHVFPLHTSRDGRCSCGRPNDECSSPGKHPRTRNGLKDASSNQANVRGWWRQWSDANVGIRTGIISGLLVVDIDPAHGGGGSLARLEAQHGALITREVETGSGGAHLYFRHPGEELGNTAGRLGPGLDTRGDGGYVVGPPSLHASGGCYRWCNATKRLGQAPEWLVKYIKPPPPPSPAEFDRAIGEIGNRYVTAAVEHEIETLWTAPEGVRNATLNTAAFNLGQLVAAGAPLDLIRDLLEDAGRACGLGELEVRRTVASGLKGGMQSPRRLKS